MRNKAVTKKEYAVIVNLIIFFAVLIVVAGIRLLIIITTHEDKITKEEYLYITEQSKLQGLDTENANLRYVNLLNERYGIDIHYGKTTEVFAKSVQAVPIMDSKRITEMLVELTRALEKYPQNIIKEMENKGYTVSIYLVDYFENANVALANRNSNNEFKIYISYNETFERAMHHETYHVLEYFMNLEYGLDNIFEDWNTLNPEGFVYPEDVNKLNRKYVYGLDKERPAYFVTLYSKYSAKEDRAEIFAENMVAETTPIYYTSNHLQNKMLTIKKGLESCFESSRINEAYWDKHI